MTALLEVRAADVAPDRDAVLERLGIPASVGLSERAEPLYAAAAEILAGSAAPAGVLADISAAEFKAVYDGEGRNAPYSPVSDVCGRAEHLALFAVTLGEQPSLELNHLFTAGDFALGYVLDAMASVAADGLAELAEQRFAALLQGRGWMPSDGAALRYSPGYCGWDVTGQRKLFAFLKPERIGITLTESCLMKPLKSVSGVIIAGPRAIHRIRPTYDFCERCEERTCTGRLRALATARV
ncbi:MAG: vitamin B12 dependent-methionine synthase activation domain-containing protein [Gemmatimonadales bacterium]